MTKVVTAVFTNRKLNIFELSQKTGSTINFLTDLDLKPGDMLSSNEFDETFEVLFIKEKDWTDDIDENLRYVTINKINGKKVSPSIFGEVNNFNNNTFNKSKSSKGMNTNSNAMFSGMLGKYKSQFIPERETNVRMSMTGLLVVPVNGEYVGIDVNNKLMSFPEEMTISIPVYSINKLNSAVQVGDIVKNGNTYAKVVGKNSDGSLKVLTYTGYTRSKKEVVDFFVNQATTRVLINMFNFDNSENSFNPLFFAFANGDHIDVNSLMMLAMTPQGKNLFSNAGGGFNPMMLMMLDSNKGGSSSLFETMAMMSMMSGGNMFGNMPNMFNSMTPATPFNSMTPATSTAPAEPTVETLVNSNVDAVSGPATDFDTIMKALSANPDLVEQLKAALNTTDKKDK